MKVKLNKQDGHCDIASPPVESRDSDAVRPLEGARRMRLWNVYALEDRVTGTAGEDCAPWIKLQLVDDDTVDAQLVQKAVQKRCPFDVLCLDLLVQTGPSSRPVWVDMSNEQGLRIPPGAPMSVRVRPKNNGSFRKVALLYYARPGEEVDIQKTAPHQILGLSDSQDPTAILKQLLSNAPDYGFEICERGPDGNGYQWQHLTHSRTEPIVPSVLRIKATMPEARDDLLWAVIEEREQEREREREEEEALIRRRWRSEGRRELTLPEWYIKGGFNGRALYT